MPMGTEDGRYTDAEWWGLTWRPCERGCGGPVIAHRMQVSGFGSPEPLYALSFAECRRRCSGPPAFGNSAYLESA